MASNLMRRVATRATHIFAAKPLARPFSSASATDLIRVTLFPGDGIGPEIAESVKQVFCYLFYIPNQRSPDLDYVSDHLCFCFYSVCLYV